MGQQPEQHRQQSANEHEGLPHDDKEHGEGNYEATHHYQEGVKRTLRDKDVEKLAKEAKDAVEGEEGDELRAAEEEGRSHIAEEDRQLYKERRGDRGAGTR